MSSSGRENTSYYVEFQSPSRIAWKIFAHFERVFQIDNYNEPSPHKINCTNNVSLTGSVSNKSSTLPLSYRYCNERQNSKDRDGYYSDRNEIIREKREREAERERGYLSDYNSKYESK